MKIANDKTIAEIQKEFSAIYSGLKIKFFKESSDGDDDTQEMEEMNPHCIIGDIRTVVSADIVTCYPKMSVAEVEENLKTKYGINAQIFRKSKDIWLQTSATDDWTLEKQNQKALLSIDPTIGLYTKS